MIDLAFSVLDARPEIHAASPALTFRLRIEEREGRAIHSILLRYQLRIETRRRRHLATEQERLADIFGEPQRWNETLKPLVWTSGSLVVPAFDRTTEADLPCLCTYDFEVTAAKYIESLEGGEVPLQFLFSGTVFAKTNNGFQVEQIPWDKEASFRMPVAIWREVMDAYFPGCAWIRLRRESLDRLQRFKASRGFVSWDEAIEALV